ncbi:hypothetical protein LINPERHAP2_LOCUS25131 [Linum perenne]
MYPIAWSVVEVESKSSWDWFLELLKLDLDIRNGYGWCFSSDQQKVKLLSPIWFGVSVCCCVQIFIQ